MRFFKTRSGVTEIRYKARNNSRKTIRMKDKVYKINGKEYGFLTTYIANCAQLYAFLKDGFLVRIGGKLRRVVLTFVELFNYRGHIHRFNYHIDNRIASQIRELRAISSPKGAESSILYCPA